MDLRMAMKNRGLSNRDLEARTGIPAATIASFKSGGRGLGAGTAERLAAHLNTSGPELVAENRVAGLKKAAESGDQAVVLKAARRVVSFAEEYGADHYCDEDLDDLVDAVTKFAGGGEFVPFSDDFVDSDRAAAYRAEGRDSMGRRIRGRESAADDLEDDFEDEDDEDGYDLDDEGRDSRGIRVRPMRNTTGGLF